MRKYLNCSLIPVKKNTWLIIWDKQIVKNYSGQNYNSDRGEIPAASYFRSSRL